MMLEVGQAAPSFTLPDADMNIAKLSDYKGKKNVVLYFYVRDDTPGCTVEATDFSDMENDFARLDTVILGVSRDDCLSHAAFRDKHGITVRLIADKEGTLCSKYGVLQDKEVDGVQRTVLVRSTFIIDRQGRIRHALYGVAAKGHAQQVLQLIKDMRNAG
jgi:thioredoxin-dependent peroxiredoxin